MASRVDDEGPVSRKATDPLSLQRYALAKLLKDPTKMVHIPDAPRDGVKGLRPPRDMMKNVQGSSAGAGSGEFHVYKQSRRREYERLKLMDEEEEMALKRKEELERHAAYQASADEKTSKNRLKRERKKAGRQKGKGGAIKNNGEGNEEGTSDDRHVTSSEAKGAEKKRKLAGTSTIKFRKAGESDDDDDDDDDIDDEEQQQPSTTPIDDNALGVHVLAEPIAPAKEAGITIQDDD